MNDSILFSLPPSLPPLGLQEVLTEPDPQLTLLVGAFSPHGVLETAQNVIDELNGLTVNRLAPKIQYMVSDRA